MWVRYISEVKEPWDRIGKVGDVRSFDDERIAQRLIKSGYCVECEPPSSAAGAPVTPPTRNRSKSDVRFEPRSNPSEA